MAKGKNSDWKDEAADIVNEAFGDDPGYEPPTIISWDEAKNSKITMEDGTTFDLIEDELKAGGYTFKRLSSVPLNIEIEWAEIDPELFERLFAEFTGEKAHRQIGLMTRAFDLLAKSVYRLTEALIELGAWLENQADSEDWYEDSEE